MTIQVSRDPRRLRVGLLSLCAFALTLVGPLSSGAGASVHTNTVPITIPDVGFASPFPSSIFAPTPGPNEPAVKQVKVTLFGFTHTFPDDLDIALRRVSFIFSNSSTVMLMSDACSDIDFTGFTVSFRVPPLPTDGVLSDTQMPAPCAPNGQTFQPVNYPPTETNPGLDPKPFGTTQYAPNATGEWELFVTDDEAGDSGSISSWKLELLPEAACAGRASTSAAAPLVTNRPENFGTSADETITGTEGPDLMMGFGGKDRFLGLGGNDVICGGDGNDNIGGGPGSDLILGEGGKDGINGGGGKDNCKGGGGRDKGKSCEKEKSI